jgi:hypothetical protein
MEKSVWLAGNRWNGNEPFFSALLNPSRRADFLFNRTEQDTIIETKFFSAFLHLDHQKFIVGICRHFYGMFWQWSTLPLFSHVAFTL